jgi:diguanylate cyclase (GGDEF)-like protein
VPTAVIVALMLIFQLDRVTASAPVQHLYYLPIMLAGLRFGRPGGLSTSMAAVLLYHLATPTLLTSGYRESDLVQIALFVAVGIVTAKLADDARRLHGLATTDDLTGLHNLRSFEARLSAMVRESRETGHPLAMLVLDVDRLKSINDTYGHLAGAEAVREVGHLLARHLPPHAVACRYGGDEFVVAIPGSRERDASAVAHDLRRAVQEIAPVLAGRRFPIRTLSISVGVACLMPEAGYEFAGDDPNDARTGEALFAAADRALYAAKNGGRNGVSVA